MATITDLDEKCLTGIFHYLDKFDLFALRRTNSRFIGATEICFKRNFADKEFRASEWKTYVQKSASEACNHLKPTIKEVIQYFGRFVKNVLVDKHFTELMKSESISKAFLSECLANVGRIAILDIDSETLSCISSWKHVKELFVGPYFTGYAGAHWPKLATLRVALCTFDPDDFIAFLESHPKLKKLHVKVGRDCSAAIDKQIIEFIAEHLLDLVDLHIGRFSPNNSTLICGLGNLESLVIKIGNDVKPFKNSKKLKYLEITNVSCISVQTLNDLVESVPTLIRVKMRAEFATVFNKAVADGLVAKRLLSSHCDTERCELEYVSFDLMDFDEHRAFVEHIENTTKDFDFSMMMNDMTDELYEEMCDQES